MDLVVFRATYLEHVRQWLMLRNGLSETEAGAMIATDWIIGYLGDAQERGILPLRAARLVAQLA